ncbi:glycosyltransferase [Poritiphilus flavus]|uniref:Glycosyltransferase n=1 Tax=Poritiphilus flavus TaxID=2697053 RepID=A0A6L9ECU4_9FLAO|nr:glycosyltransferase [Poritiphilus flavus]NAS12358.1 glycosyltransferase [Poritiphilus flavus]
MRLSIVIPCYNMEAYLPQCLDSLLAQELDPDEHEIIVVNDGSKDRTLEIAKSYQAQNPQIEIIDKKNAGVGAARNSGLDKAIGAYIYFLDPDDYLVENRLHEVLNLAESQQVDILSFISIPVGKDDYITDGAPFEPVCELDISDGISYIAKKKFHNEIWWYLVRKEFLTSNNHRFIEGRWMEDAILTAELFCTAKRMAHVDIDLHRYRILPTSAMRNKTPEHYNKVIFDNANAAHVFDGLIKEIPKEHPKAEKCIQRLKTRQQSFVFFLLVRLMKSDLSVKRIPEMLSGFEEIDAYPLKKFLGKDYSGFSYSFMVFIFNRKYLINPFIKIFRTFYAIVR